MNPCGFQGYSVNKTKEDLYQAPCVKGDFAKNLFGNEINPNLTMLSKSFLKIFARFEIVDLVNFITQNNTTFRYS